MCTLRLSDRRDYCFTCSQGQKLLSVAVWDVKTGIICRVYSCDTGVTTGAGSTGVGGASAVCLLGETHLLCAPKVVPFIYVWNLKKEQVMLKIACVGVVQALCCTPDGVYCAAGIAEKIYVWHVCTGNLVGVVSQHFQPVSVLEFTDDGAHLCSGGRDGRVIAWTLVSVVSSAPLHSMNGLSSPATSLASSRSLTRHVWADHTLPVTGLHCGKGGMQCRLFTCSLDQTCKIYELSSGKMLCSILFSFGLTCLAVDLAERCLFVGGSNGKISRVNLYTKPLGPDVAEEKEVYEGHTKSVSGLAVGCWDSILVSTSPFDDKARVWDIASHQTIREVKMKGPISEMLLCGGLLQSLSKQDSSSLVVPTVKVFKKQMRSSSTEDKEKPLSQSSLFPIQLQGIDPLSSMVNVLELQAMYCPPKFNISDPSKKDFVLHSVRQELAELKDVNQKLYSFCMDKLIT